MNKKIVHDALILFAFTIVLGLLLGVVYGVTKPSIDKVNEEKTQNAYKQVFTDEIETVVAAQDASENTLGYVFTVTAKDGSQGSITFSVGIQNDGTVNGYSITSISETPGLGMKAQEEDFYGQFENKKVDSFTVVKSAPSADNEIEAISGSTITSKAMANGVNACLTYFQNVLAGGTN